MLFSLKEVVFHTVKMLMLQWYLSSYLALLMSVATSNGMHIDRTLPINYPTIYVDPSGNGNFSTIQSAINFVPSDNKNWIRIYIKAGTYQEQVVIPFYKPFIYLQGEGKRKTIVVSDDSESTETATFTSQADDIVAKSITFVNSHNYPPSNNKNPVRPAVAGKISGDRSVFYRCAFLGFQDTLWDVYGRHYFKRCTIQGAIDFIFGSGQSIYEGCTISVVAGPLDGMAGFITAQSRSEPQETNGFVFKGCNVIGRGLAYLGRPWRQYARVVFYNTTMSDIIVPEGWSAWDKVGRDIILYGCYPGVEWYKKHPANGILLDALNFVLNGFGSHYYQGSLLTFAEYYCHGPGADNSRRVSWATKLNEADLQKFISMSFIDNEGWTIRQPFHMLA